MFSKLQKRRHSFSSSLGKENKSRPHRKLTSSASLSTVSEEAVQHISVPSHERKDATGRRSRRSLMEILKFKKQRKLQENGTQNSKVRKEKGEVFIMIVMRY